MRLEPLDDIEAEHLFLRPFEDLGIEVRDRRAVLQMMRDLTGSLPHLVQFYGKTMANVLFDQSQSSWTLKRWSWPGMRSKQPGSF